MMRFLPEPGSPGDRVATFIMASLAWSMLAAPLITLPIATVGLFGTMLPWVQGKDVEFFSGFFGTIRQRWLKSIVIAAFNVLLVSIVFANLQILPLMSLPVIVLRMFQGIMLSVGLIVIWMNFYLWTLLVISDLKPLKLLDLSWRFALAHPFWSILNMVAVLALLWLGQFAPIWLNIIAMPSMIAITVNWFAWKVIKSNLSTDTDS